MPSTHHEITALPVVIPFGAVAFAALLWHLNRRAAISVPRVVAAATMCVYGAGVVANTLLPIYIGNNDDHGSWRVFLNLVPLANTEPFEMIQNVLVFMPLGLLLPLIARANSVRRVLLVGFLVSFTMETLQLINAVTGHGGHIADINDLLANTLGAPIGYAIYRFAVLLPFVGRLAHAATWPRRPIEPVYES